MQEDLKLIDLIIELVDARIPVSSRNPDLRELGKQKSRLVLFNKSDLADEKQNAAWAEKMKQEGAHTLFVDARKRSTLKELQEVIRQACREKIERDARRGIKNRPIRAMVVGIPNVGKSTFINSYAGKAAAKTGNRPGVTKGKQWIRMGKNLELLDTPGILWPKFEDPEVGMHLAMTGSVRDEILNGEEVACALIELLRTSYPGRLAERYEITEEGKDYEVLLAIAEQRKCITKGGELSSEKAAAILLDEYRSGRLGRITLEWSEKA